MGSGNGEGKTTNGKKPAPDSSDEDSRSPSPPLPVAKKKEKASKGKGARWYTYQNWSRTIGQGQLFLKIIFLAALFHVVWKIAIVMDGPVDRSTDTLLMSVLRKNSGTISLTICICMLSAKMPIL